MQCQTCKSDRVVEITSKCSDLCFTTYKGREKDGYVPQDIGIGGGDYVSINFYI